MYAAPQVVGGGYTDQGLAYEDWDSGARTTAVRQASIESTSLAPLAADSGLMDSGRASMNSYWSDKQDAAVAGGSPPSYMAARGMQTLGNVGYSVADMTLAVYNDPEQ